MTYQTYNQHREAELQRERDEARRKIVHMEDLVTFFADYSPGWSNYNFRWSSAERLIVRGPDNWRYYFRFHQCPENKGDLVLDYAEDLGERFTTT